MSKIEIVSALMGLECKRRDNKTNIHVKRDKFHDERHRDCHGTKEQGISKSKESRGIFLEEMMLML